MVILTEFPKKIEGEGRPSMDKLAANQEVGILLNKLTGISKEDRYELVQFIFNDIKQCGSCNLTTDQMAGAICSTTATLLRARAPRHSTKKLREPGRLHGRLCAERCRRRMVEKSTRDG